MSMSDLLELSNKILHIFIKYAYVPSSVAHKRLASDIAKQGVEVLQLAQTMSPSQLGRMRFIGIRRLAQCKRDEPKKFAEIIKDLEAML